MITNLEQLITESSQYETRQSSLTMIRSFKRTGGDIERWLDVCSIAASRTCCTAGTVPATRRGKPEDEDHS